MCWVKRRLQEQEWFQRDQLEAIVVIQVKNDNDGGVGIVKAEK